MQPEELLCCPPPPRPQPSGDGHPPASTPDLPDPDAPLRQQLRDALWQAHSYQAMHRLARQREELLKQQLAQLHAEIRDLRHRLFGHKSEAQAEQELKEEPLHPARRKALVSLGEHWTGLTVFVEHPEVPLDNNTAERAERGPVVGRKNDYGSGAVWSGRLAAVLFSLFGTLQQWRLNPRTWLSWYLTACAEAGGKVPEQVEAYLPWKMSPQQRQALQGPPTGDQTKEQPNTS